MAKNKDKKKEKKAKNKDTVKDVYPNHNPENAR